MYVFHDSTVSQGKTTALNIGTVENGYNLTTIYSLSDRLKFSKNFLFKLSSKMKWQCLRHL